MSRRRGVLWLPLLLVCAGCSGAPQVVQIPDSAPAGAGRTASEPADAPVGDGSTDAPFGAPAGGTGASTPGATGASTPGATGTPGVFVVPDRPVVAPDAPAYELQVRGPLRPSLDEVAVVAAWEEFWQALVTGSGVPEHRPGPMGEVATGQALVDAEGYVTGLVEARQRVTGRLVLAADSVRVDGDRAVVAGCSDQQDHEVDGAGAALDAPEGPSDLVTELVREGDRWQVSLWGVHGSC